MVDWVLEVELRASGVLVRELLLDVEQRVGRRVLQSCIMQVLLELTWRSVSDYDHTYS